MLEILRFTTGQQDEDDGAEPALANGAPSSFAQVQVACRMHPNPGLAPQTRSLIRIWLASIGLSFVAVTNKQFAQNNISSAKKRKGQRFPHKLFEMLEGAEESSYSSIVSWNTDGRSFTIHDSEALMQQVVPLYFQQTHFRSFVSKNYCLLSLYCCFHCS